MEESMNYWGEDTGIEIDEPFDGIEVDENLVEAWGNASNDELLDELVGSIALETIPLVENVSEYVESKKKKKEKRKATPFFERPVIAMDTEYVESECGTYNRILSYQFAVLYKGKLSTTILFP
ncbi:hypothetical protein EA003_20180, partial [Vibrio anguillarum]|nr:hypothetical protein [Vibrio anguillarum]